MKTVKIKKNCHTLRCAAGGYWLLDMSQAGVPYKKPMSLNEVGAKIWRFLEKNISTDIICKELSAEYEVAEEVIYDDMMQFLNQLKAYGVEIEE